MGLDQYAYIKTAESGEEGESAKFTWRKHSQLQTFMEGLYTERTGLDATDLNCGELVLQASDIDSLEKAVKDSALPHCEGGFFYGHQFQDEQASEYRDYDLEFCAWARTQMQAGSTVIYSCWW
ncbi:phosphoglycerate kinase [Yoonia sp. I 8.24]|uniref:phosphoglycerate kinase n=1 Tax=Yoonia sp. I 8.24 TaxID=1537229 RepID=UPI001EE0709F|nr:phosphoglycerate kinase [Yoonia sp. I 8.24]MCG3269567.1 phosphoglycerate kinase [Yoonia sp. I 8.24]